MSRDDFRFGWHAVEAIPILYVHEWQPGEPWPPVSIARGEMPVQRYTLPSGEVVEYAVVGVTAHIRRIAVGPAPDAEAG